MQHSRGYCGILKLLLPIALLIGTLAPVQAADYPLQMKLLANGQTLTLSLRPSRVTKNIDVVDHNGSAQGIPVRTYIGKIKGDANSWVRLTKSNNSLDGVISRYGKRFRLKQTGNRSAEIKPLADNHDHRITLTKNTLNRTKYNTNAASDVTRVAKIAIAVDSKFNARHNGKGLEYALALINSVDGIYREEFGLALQVETAINVVDPQADPFNYGNVAIESMLRNFREYRMRSTLIDNDISLVHLFTGNQPADEPVGLAWIDTACRTDGYDVGISTPYKHDILLAAHEIAHNLGALHDSETACATSMDKVMWPYISSGTSQHFSRCTVETVKRALATSCHAEAIDLELALSVDNGNTVKATVRNTDLLRANPAATLAIDLPEGGSATAVQGDCAANNANQDTAPGIECKVGALEPGSDSVIIFQVDTTLTDELFASVDPDQFIDISKDNNRGQIASGDRKLFVVEAANPAIALQSIKVNTLAARPVNGPVNGGAGAFPFTLSFFILVLFAGTRSTRRK